jgi:hypothetical protein
VPLKGYIMEIWSKNENILPNDSGRSKSNKLAGLAKIKVRVKCK